MEANRVVVRIADPGLARVLILWLRDALVRHEVVGGEVAPRRGDVVLSTPADCNPIAAAECVSQGIHPIILTPVPRRDEVSSYARAGAAYVVMSIDNSGSLERAVLAALDPQSPPPMAFRAAASHVSSPRPA